ncbi:MAG: ABC transporter ATP-binding protein [Sporomusa sp.]
MRPVVLQITDIEVFRNKRKTLAIERLEVPAGEILAVIGPNGAGKSTLLQVINMHLAYSSGRMVLFGQDAGAVDKHILRRRCSMVFQETLLLNDTVYNNVALALRFRGMVEAEIKDKVNRALTNFHCAHLSSRLACKLSGGEAQRVCLARALVYEPELLLLDEPFASLDSPTRNALLTELRQVAVAHGITVVLVSHSFNDILYFAERAVVLQDGRIVQDDTPEVILRRPVNVTIASLVGMDNILPCQVHKYDDGVYVQLVNGVHFPWRGEEHSKTAFCCLPGDALSIINEPLPYSKNPLVVTEGIVSQIVPGIGMYRIIVETKGMSLTLRVPREQVASKVSMGMPINIAFNPEEAQLV